MPDFSQRSTQDELMDDPDAPEKELWQNLRELEVINKYLGGYRVVLEGLNKLDLPKETSVMDLGSGGGDTLRAIADWMNKRQRTARLTGIDYNPVMTAYATQHSKYYPAITFRTLDIFDEALTAEKADVVTCSLFCHHFAHDSLVKLIRRMRELCIEAIVINDLHRHWFAYYSIKMITGICSKTYMVKHDAALSVARAFTRKDWEQVMRDAGISQYELTWKWAFRWLLIIPKKQTG